MEFNCTSRLPCLLTGYNFPKRYPRSLNLLFSSPNSRFKLALAALDRVLLFRSTSPYTSHRQSSASHSLLRTVGRISSPTSLHRRIKIVSSTQWLNLLVKITSPIHRLLRAWGFLPLFCRSSCFIALLVPFEWLDFLSNLDHP